MKKRRGPDIFTGPIIKDHIQQIWGDMSGPIRVIVSSWREVPGEEEACGDVVGEGELYGAFFIVPALASLYSPSQVSLHLSSRLPPDIKSANVICLGGPRTNAATALMVEKWEELGGIRFCFKGYDIYDLEKGILYSAKLRGEAEGKSIDYGMVLKKQNPFDPHKLVFVLAGCRTIGTQAASVALCSADGVARVTGQYHRSSFELLVEREIGNPDSSEEYLAVLEGLPGCPIPYRNPGPGVLNFEQIEDFWSRPLSEIQGRWTTVLALATFALLLMWGAVWAAQIPGAFAMSGLAVFVLAIIFHQLARSAISVVPLWLATILAYGGLTWFLLGLLFAVLGR